jgi:hypothetical protein
VDPASAFGGPFLGEVWVGELAEGFDGGVVVGLGGGDLVWEKAEPAQSALDPELCTDSALSVVDAFESGLCAARLRAIVSILPWSADAEIEPAVVGHVAVPVVHDHPFRRLHDLAVHEDRPAPVGSCGVSAAVYVPFPLVEPLVVGGVHVGVVASSQWNQADIALGGNGLAPVVLAGDARDLVQASGPLGVVGARRQDRLAQAHRTKPCLLVADGIDAVVTVRSRHDYSLPLAFRAGDSVPADNRSLYMT